MNKHIIAIIALAGVVFAGDYTVNVQKQVPTTATTTVTATTATVKSLMVITDKAEPIFIIRVELKDASGTVLETKHIRMTMTEATALMPTLPSVMSNATEAIAANIETLLGE